MAKPELPEAAPDTTKHTAKRGLGKYEAERCQLFDAVLQQDDVSQLKNVIESIRSKVVVSDLLDANNGMMNVLNYAIEHGKYDAAVVLAPYSDDEMILNEYFVPDAQTNRTALHQIILTSAFSKKQKLTIATSLLRKVKNKQKALTLETKYEVKGQRERTFPCLHLSALLGNKKLLRLFIEIGKSCGVDINHQNAKHDAAILWAAREGHDKLIAILLENGADPNIANDKKSAAIHWAVRYERLSTVKTLLNSAKTDANKIRSLGLYTPLIMASAFGFLDIAKVLIDKGADVNLMAPGGVVALHMATEEGHLELVKLLLRKKADFTIEDSKGDSAIVIAARKGHAKVVLTLLHWMDDPYRKNHSGHDAWYYAIESADESVLRTLLDFYNLNPKTGSDSDGNVFQTKSPLFTAASLGKCDKIEYILNSGVKADILDLEGNTFLHYAVINDQVEVIKRFHSYCNINSANKRLETCLHTAVTLGKHNSVLALIKSGARTDVKNSCERNVLHVAARSPNTTPEIAKELVAYTIQAHSWNAVNDIDNHQNNALHTAAKYANPDVIWEFRRLSFKMQNDKGNTPFHRAVRVGNPEVLETMLDIFESMQRTGNINEKNKKGETVLHLAVMAGFSDTVKRLVYLRADLDVKDTHGNTPLHCLVKLSVEREDPEHQRVCLSTLDAIIYESPRWFCYSDLFKGQNFTFFSEDAKLILRYRRQALTWLLHKTINNESMSVFTLCFAVGAHEILSKLLTLKGIKYFNNEEYHFNDVADITPLTNGSLAQRYFNSWSNQVTPNICGLELLGNVNDHKRASKVLDIIPIRYLEKIYGKLNLITFMFLIFIHLAYMFIFSFAGIEVSKSFQNSTYVFDPSNLMIVAVYVVVPIEPFVLILFTLVTFCSAVRRRDFKKPIRSVLPFIFYFIYSSLVIAWIVLVSVGQRYQDYVLAVCLFCGWLYTIVLTRGLKGIHYFWKMISYMVVNDTSRFLFVYLCVLFAFSFSLHVLLQLSSSLSSSYSDVAETIFLSFNMMLGMGELFDDNFSQGMADVGRTTGFTKVLFVVYIVLASIILLNMLIAMMNESYLTVSEEQKLLWRIESIQLGVRIERLLPLSRHLFKSLGVDLMEVPGEEKGFKVQGKVVMKYFLKLKRGFAVVESVAHNAREQRNKSYEVVKEQISSLNERLSASQDEMKENRQKLEGIEDKLTAILKTLKKDT